MQNGCEGPAMDANLRLMIGKPSGRVHLVASVRGPDAEMVA